MTYIASHIATVPTQGFQWYLIFLESSYEDELHKDIDRHFETLGREVGKDILAVRGFDAATFRDSVYEAPAFLDDTWRARAKFPCLIVTNRVPSQAVSAANMLQQGKVMIFPLAEIYQEQKSIAGFLSDLTEALKQEDTIEALEALDGNKL